MQIGLNLAQSRPALVSKYSHDGCVRLPARRGPGRPGIMLEITALIVRMAQESPGWGYTRLQRALAHLRHKAGGSLVSVVLSQAFDEVAAKCS
jgi:hypothetical protein